ncbi:uncharacterized protein EKO05_0006699 [Ascochyta rabiei]|uniref:uncharacterized protein n=1 Tax=Didymella rabiei TaxID=5454 RepID=UPI0021FB20EC|nr:uncharacterized protein EKO05_0006699 [Ascochyta rabiei]UPX16290.1 hypothetical protein EKO05_0006699 [Ascochyta rabiei]
MLLPRRQNLPFRCTIASLVHSKVVRVAAEASEVPFSTTTAGTILASENTPSVDYIKFLWFSKRWK